jgi:hypothetical protein
MLTKCCLSFGQPILVRGIRYNDAQRFAALRSGGFSEHKTVNLLLKPNRSTSLEFTNVAPPDAKRLLGAALLFLSSVFHSFSVGFVGALAWWLFCIFLFGLVRLEKMQMCYQESWVFQFFTS